MVLTDLGSRSWHLKSIKNRSKKELNLGRHLGIDFSLILVDFPTQLGPPNPPKSKKNRCQEALYVGLQILIDFGSIFAPNFDPRILGNHCFSIGKTRFFKKSTLEDNLDLCSILEANMEASWHQNRCRNRCYLGKALF